MTDDVYFVLQLKEFPGLVFEGVAFDEIYTPIVTEENFEEIYGHDLLEDLEMYKESKNSIDSGDFVKGDDGMNKPKFRKR